MKNLKALIGSNESGQSTVEFLICFVFIIGILFIYVKISMNFTRGYMVQFVNFQASRAYLVSDSNRADDGNADTDALNKAKIVWNKYFNDFGGGIEPTSNDPGFGGKSIFVGTIVDYQEKFALGFPFAGMDPMDLKAESFLGREPTRATCLRRTCDSMRDLGANDCSRHMTLDDNGC